MCDCTQVMLPLRGVGCSGASGPLVGIPAGLPRGLPDVG